jgi:hypothetical protein
MAVQEKTNVPVVAVALLEQAVMLLAHLKPEAQAAPELLPLYLDLL